MNCLWIYERVDKADMHDDVAVLDLPHAVLVSFLQGRLPGREKKQK